jgi:signal transduction histidine kinase
MTRLRHGGATVRFVHALLRRLRGHTVEVLAPVFAAASVAEALLAGGVHDRAGVSVCALFWSLPYALRRWNPAVPPFVAAGALVALGLVGGEGTADLSMPFLAALLTAVSFGLMPDERQRIAGWCAVVGAAAVIDYESSSAFSDFFWTTLILSIAWFFGVALGKRTAQARELRARVERERGRVASAAEEAAAEERTRITRELHDVVAHSVSVMVVQASGVRRLLTPEQEREREALLAVEQIGREALAEMRRMLGVMRSGEAQPPSLAPQPGLKSLDHLIAQIEEAGLPVTLHVEGERAVLPPGIDLSAYRIVQEALTNALKHAAGAHADVTVRYGSDRLELEIADDGPGSANGNAMEGHGLVGMRERVALYGGTLEAGPRDGGGFVLRAQLPVEACS